MNISEYRKSLAAQNNGVDPYADLPDQDFAAKLHQTHYADVPFQDFATKVGLPGDFRDLGPQTRAATNPKLNRTEQRMGAALASAVPQGSMQRMGKEGGVPSSIQGADDTTLRAIQRTPGVVGRGALAALKATGAGIRRGFADINTGMALAAEESYRDPLVSPGAEQQQAAVQGASERAFAGEMEQGRAGRIVRRASAEAQAATPTDAGPVERAVQSGLTSAAVTVPIVTAGAMIPGGQVPALVALGGMSGAQRYGELRAAGKSEGESALSGAYLGGLEALTEAIPLGTLAKRSPFVKRAAEFLVQDVLGENVSTAAQIADDYRLQLREDVTMADIKQALQDTTAATIVGAGAQLTASGLMGLVIDQANARAQAREPAIEQPQIDVEPPTFGDESMQVEQTFPDEEITLEGDGEVQPSAPVVDEATTQVEEAPAGEEITLEGDGEMLPGEIRVDEDDGEPPPPGGGDRRREHITLETDPMEEFRRQDEETAGDEELADVEIEEPSSGPPAAVIGSPGTEPEAPTMAQRRELLKAKHHAVEVNIRPETKPRDVTYVQSPDGLHGVAIGGQTLAWYGSQEMAREEVRAVRADIASRATQKPQETRTPKPLPVAGQKPIASTAQTVKPAAMVLGQPVEAPAEPTEGQKRSGGYFKPEVKWQGLTLKIENLKGSERSGVGEDGKPWSRTLNHTYGYVKGSTGADKDAVDVFIGDQADSDTVYVVDQLKADGSFDEHKVLAAFPSQQAAEAAYRSNYPKNWAGMGAITAVPVEKFKAWVNSPAAKKPMAWKPSKPSEKQEVDRLQSDTTLRSSLQFMANEAGWEQEGGKMLRASNDFNDPDYNKVTGRTQWLPRAEWWPDRPKGFNERQVRAIVTKALAGEKLSKPDQRLIDFMTQVSDERNRLAQYLPRDEELPEDSGIDDAFESAMVARASELDEETVERLAIRYAEDQNGFLRAVKAYLDDHDDKATLAGREESKSAPRERTQGQGQARVAGDLFGDDVRTRQAIADESRRRDERRSPNKDVPLETGRPDDLFSQSRRQVDLTDTLSTDQIDSLTDAQLDERLKRVQAALASSEKRAAPKGDEEIIPFQRTTEKRAPLTDAVVRQFADDTQKKHGLKSFDVYLHSNGDIKLSMIEVPRESRKQGIGSKAMEELTRFADQHNARVVLTLGQRGDGFGTTSTGRLERFYRQHGFVRNKGRNKDFRISESMYRNPSAPSFQRTVKGKSLQDELARLQEAKAKRDDPIFHRVYHGSPHRFTQFRLDDTTISTGEGGQAFGWGLYFAENPVVADQYRPQVTWKRSYKLRGRDLTEVYSEFTDRGKYDLATVAERILTHHSRDRIEKFIRENWDDPDASQQEAVKWFKSLPKSLFAKPGGSLYQAEIKDESIPLMMNWDDGLMQQPDAVRKAFAEADLLAPYKVAGGQPIETGPIVEDLTVTAENESALHDKPEVFQTLETYRKNPSDPAVRSKLNRWFRNYPYDREKYKSMLEAQEAQWAVTTGHLYHDLAKKLGSAKAASLYLKERGVPGIRYLDQQSRDGDGGTRNIVAFDDSIITVTHVDGTPVSAEERKDVIDPMFRRGAQPSKLTERDVKAEINRLLRPYKVRPALMVVQDYDQLPAPVRARIEARGGKKGDMRAFLYNGTFYAIADDVPTLADLNETVFHEMTHFGTRALLDPEVRAEILDGMARDMRMEVRRHGVEEFGDAWDESNDGMRRLAAEERLAYYGQRYLAGQTIPDRIRRWVDKWLAAIRDFVRQVLGKDRKFDELFMKRLLQELQAGLKSGRAETQADRGEAPVMQSKAPTFYSQLLRNAETAKREKGTAAEWLNTLRNMQGTKPEEIEWSGLEEWINALDHRATKDEIVDYLRANQIEVQDVLKGGARSNDGAARLDERRRSIVVELSALGWQINLNDDTSELESIYDRDGQEFRWKPTKNPANPSGPALRQSLTDEWEGEETGDDGEFVKTPPEIARLANEYDDIARQLSREAYEAEQDETQYSKYTLPGGENYRELLLTLPVKKETRLVGVTSNGAVFSEKELEDPIVRRTAEKVGLRMEWRDFGDEPYKSSHWSEPNILAHVRFDERTDAYGKRVLHIAEIQSDWHQAGRKKGYRSKAPQLPDGFKVVDHGRRFSVQGPDGYNVGEPQASREAAIENAARILEADGNTAADRYQTSKVPDAPFKTTWPELAFKRMIRFAVENGFERITWDTGQISADRYDLSKQVDVVEWALVYDDIVDVWFKKRGSREQERAGRHKVDALVDVIGKDLADRVAADLNAGKKNGEYRDADLKVGGEGMIGFYDQILPAAVNKMVKKWGAKVGTTKVQTAQSFRKLEAPMMGREAVPVDGDVHSVDVTDSMRAAALEGLPLFQRTSSVMQRTLPKKSGEARGYAAVANRIIDGFNNKFGWRYGALGRLPGAKEYLVERYKTLGALTQVREITRDIFSTLSQASTQDSERIYAYLTTAGATADSIENQKIRDVAIHVKEAIDAQGRALVDAGLLSEESYDTYKDQYLPRLYLRHILDDGKGRAATGTGKKLSDMGYLKQRKDIPEEVRKVILGEITDPAFLSAFGLSRTMRDLAIMNFLDTIAQNKAWTPQVMLVEYDGRKVSPFWLAEEAKQLRLQADHLKAKPATAAKARTIADGMDTLANRAIEAMQGVDLTDFEQIPNSPRYGALRGLYVRKEIHEDLVGAYNFIQTDSLLENIFGQGGFLTKATQAWKTSKVALNIPSHFRNMMGNTIMLHLSGVPMHRVPQRLVQAIDSIVRKDNFYQTAVKFGLKEATFANRELARIRDEWILLQKSKQPTANIVHAMAAKFTNAVGDVYQFEEAVFKIAKLIDGMERQGLNESDAMIESHKWIFDYSLVPRAVRYLRNAPFGIPFLSYAYFALPRLAEVAIKRPWAYLPYIAAGYALQETVMAAFGAGEDALRRLKNAFPDWMKSKGGMYLMPQRDQEGRLQMIDLGYTVPWGMLADTMAQVAQGEFRQSAETLGLLSGPIPDVVAAWQTGIDPFTGREIAAPGDTPGMKAMSYLSYAYGMAAPGFLTDKGALGKVRDAYTGKVDPRSGEPGLTKTQAWLRLFGVSVYPIDPEVTRDRNIRSMRFEIDEARRRMGEKIRDRNLDEAGQEEVRKVFQKEIDRRIEALERYEEESEIPDTFKRKTTDELTSELAPLITGKRKADQVAAIREAGYPEFAALWDAMPSKPRPVVSKAMQEQLGA